MGDVSKCSWSNNISLYLFDTQSNTLFNCCRSSTCIYLLSLSGSMNNMNSPSWTTAY
jgi:hypothetical protein